MKQIYPFPCFNFCFWLWFLCYDYFWHFLISLFGLFHFLLPLLNKIDFNALSGVTASVVSYFLCFLVSVFASVSILWCHWCVYVIYFGFSYCFLISLFFVSIFRCCWYVMMFLLRLISSFVNVFGISLFLHLTVSPFPFFRFVILFLM